MKIGGPKGPGPISPPPPQASAPSAISGPKFDKVLGGDQLQVSPAAGSKVEEVQRKLEAEEITGAQATEMIIDAIVRSKITAMKPALQETLRSRLQQLISEDPILAQKVKTLTEED